MMAETGEVTSYAELERRSNQAAHLMRSLGHEMVADVAVFGIPNDDLGEEVKAVVQPRDWSAAGPELASQLAAFCRETLSPVKCPRSIDFTAALPRLENGKLYKRKLRDSYQSR